MSNIRRAKKSFTTSVDGRRVRVSEGDLYYDHDRVVTGRDDLFDDVEDFVQRRYDAAKKSPLVEQATAAPGEKRSFPRRGRKPKDEKPQAPDAVVEEE